MKRPNIFKNHRLLFLTSFVIVAIIGFGAAYRLGSRERPIVKNQCDDYCVALRVGGASPDSIAVPTGSYVQFNSADGKTHNLSQGSGGEEHNHHGKFYSGEFKANEAWRVQFNNEGSFIFHDHFNPTISILVVVYSPGKEYKLP
jgi:hypothetical protein